MTQVVVINGIGGSGKDTFVEACNKVYGYRVYNLSMIDYIKKIAQSLGWDGKKDNKGRSFLSDLKDSLESYNDSPYIAVKEEIQKIINYDKNNKELTVIFVHAREPIDIARFVNDYNAFTVLVRRPVVECEATFTNHADLDVLDYHPYDYIYWNISSKDRVGEDAKNFLEIVEKFGTKIEED